MKKQNRQLEDNMVRLFKANRVSNMPTEKFTNDLINDVLHELESDQYRRQKRDETAKSYFPTWLKVAAVFLICGGLFCAVMVNIGNRVSNKMNSVDSSLNGDEEPETPPEPPEMEGLSE